MSTSLNYNGVDFGFLKTHSVDHKPVFDPTNTDQIHTLVTLSVESLLYLSNDGVTFVSSGKQAGGVQTPVGLATRIALLQKQLEQPRQQLVFKMNGIDIAPTIRPIAAVFGLSAIDEANGPKVTNCRITAISTMGVRIEWSCEVAINLGQSALSLSNQNPVASLRWEQTQDIDDAGYSTITTQGMLIGRSNILTSLGYFAPIVGVDVLRGYIVPPLANGFIRKGQYVIQSDGLCIKFILRDQQQFSMPIAPFVKCKGTFTRIAENNARWSVQVEFAGTYQYAKDRLNAVALAMAIATTRLMCASISTKFVASSLTQPAHWVPIFRRGHIREHMYDPIVEVSLSAIAKPPAGAKITRILNNPAIKGAIHGNVGLAASAEMGFGFDPTLRNGVKVPKGAIDLTQRNLGDAGGENPGTAMLKGLELLALALRDENTAGRAATEFLSGKILTFPNIPGGCLY